MRPEPFADCSQAQIAEVKEVVAAMNQDPTALATTGVTVAACKYMFVSGDKDEVYAKKGQEGVVFCKCNTCVIVGFHSAPTPRRAACARNTLAVVPPHPFRPSTPCVSTPASFRRGVVP